MRHSPFEVEVGEEAGFQKVRAWGPGLKTGMVGKSADFVVEAIGTEVGTLGKTFCLSNLCEASFNVLQKHFRPSNFFTFCDYKTTQCIDCKVQGKG